MANDLNQCNFIGRAGKDPEMRYATSGTAIANLSLAVGYKYKDTESTEWLRVVAFGKLAEIVEKYVTKGKQIFLSGRLQTNQWEDKEGNKRYTTEIIANNIQFLGGRNDSDQHQRAEPVADGDEEIAF